MIRKTVKNIRRPSTSDRENLPDNRLSLYGIHAVVAALCNDSRTCHHLFVTLRTRDHISMFLKRRSVGTSIVENAFLDDRLGQDTVHQGVLLLVSPLPSIPIQHLDRNAPILVLDQVTDPRNVGAILRSAAAFGAAGVICQHRHAPAPEAALAKAAAGALEHVPYIQVPNIARALQTLKQNKRWIVGLDDSAPSTTAMLAQYRPVALLLGSEGKGLRHLIKDQCDILLRFALPGKIKVLNVSNAAAIALYAMQEDQTN